MATTSRLTVRTLCLATIALVLACGHAARAMAQQRVDRVPAAKTSSVIRVSPAGLGRTTVATVTRGTSSGSRSSGSSRVATFSGKSGSSGGSTTVVTFHGDKYVRVASATPKPQRTQVKPVRKTAKLEAKEPAVITIRRSGAEAPPQPAPAPVAASKAPDPAKPTRPAVRNVFGGLSSAAEQQSFDAPRTYAQASDR